jgi:hypothetical protein
VKIVRTLRLWFREGSSDKVYEVDLVDTEAQDANARFLVNFRYGRRGRVPRDGTKTPSPVSRALAEKLFDSVVVSKVNDGYRRMDGAEPHEIPVETAVATPAPGREQALLAHLEACLRNPWPEKQRDRLFWRVGELRLNPAAALLQQMAHKIGFAQVSYSLVWSLARCAGGDAADMLRAIAAETQVPLIRDLAAFALISPLMGERRLPPQQERPLPESIVHAVSGGDFERDAAPSWDLALPEPLRDRAALAARRRVDALHGALADFARREPVRTGGVMIELYRLAQADPALHELLVALVGRLPVRPPYVPGFRRLFKYAEMIDDAAMFGATARRFETAKPMYGRVNPQGRNKPPFAYVPEAQQAGNQWLPLTHLAGAPDARTALSQNTVVYLKRRIWRALRKRGETGQRSFVPLAAGYLLAFTEADLSPPQELTFYRWENRTRTAHYHFHGPLAEAWSAGQLLYRNAPGVRLQHGTLSHYLTEKPDPKQRGEAFRELWDDAPDEALRLAVESRCEPIAQFGLRILQDKPSFMRGLPSGSLEMLLASPILPVAQFALDQARIRLAYGEIDDGLIAALLASGLPDARELAIKHVYRLPAGPWASPRLGFIAVTSAHEDVQAAALRWCAERTLPAEDGQALAQQVAHWLLDNPDAARITQLRRCLPLLWRGHNLPLPPEMIARLMGHAGPAVVATGIDMLALSGVDAAALPDALWQQLLNSPEPEIQAAALGLLGRLGDEQLAERAFLIVSMASAPSPAVRQAVRPLIARLTARFPRLGDDLAARLIDALFQSAPDDSHTDDMVALFREALPTQLAALDPNLIWRMLQAKAKGAQLLGATAVTMRDTSIYSVRQLARLGNHSHAAVRQWVMAAYEAKPDRFRHEAEDAVLLIESQWEDAYNFAMAAFERWPVEVWTPNVLAVIADSTNPKILAYARTVLRRTMKPGDASAQLMRLLEHPAASMHLLISEVLTANAAEDDTVFAKLLPLSRIIMLQVHQGRVAKDRIGGFLHAEALKTQERAEAVAPLFIDLSLSAIERDRTRALTALRDIENAFPGLAAMSPLKRVAVAVRTA